MPARFTGKPSKSTDLVSCTGALSRGLKNTSHGLWCEEQALRSYQKKNYHCLERRLKTPFAEIDLVLRSPDSELVFVEVKSVASFEFLHLRLKPQQKRRLQRALLWSLEKEPRTRLELAVVSQQGEVLIFNDIFG